MPIEDDNEIRRILETSKTIALVGASPKPWRESNSIGRFLIDAGYTVYPVNPNYAEVFGLRCYADVKAIPVKVDIVDVFRQSSSVPAIVEEAIAANARTLWLQLGILHQEAAARAERAGLNVVMDRCIAVDYRRLMG